VLTTKLKFEKADIDEYSGRPLTRDAAPRKSFACDGCRRTSLPGVYGPVDGKDLWLYAACFKPIQDSRP